MGITCKPFGKDKSVFKKLENRLEEEKRLVKLTKAQEKSKVKADNNKEGVN